MRTLNLPFLLVFLASCGGSEDPVAPAAQPSRAVPGLATLEPGAVREIFQRLRVNVVFIGYEQGDGDREIDLGAFLAGLPHSNRSIVRAPEMYGMRKYAGQRFEYDYNVVFADQPYEDDFFAYLSSIAIPRPRITAFQSSYNQQARSPEPVPRG